MSGRLVSMRGLLYFLMLIFLVFSSGCSKSDDPVLTAYRASGTYSYSDGTLTMTWTNSNFLCNGPVEGSTNAKTGVTVSATTMTWSDDHDGDVMIWTRPGGTADDPAGTWERTDEEGNTHTLQVAVADSASGTVSWLATIYSCAGNAFPAGNAVCGNAVCESGENAENCPNDCKIGVNRLWPHLCAYLYNHTDKTIYWKGTWVADHSFGWTAVNFADYSCRHYGGTIFNHIQIRDADGRIYDAGPHAFTDLIDQDRYISYTFTGTNVKTCPQGEDDFYHQCP